MPSEGHEELRQEAVAFAWSMGDELKDVGHVV